MKAEKLCIEVVHARRSLWSRDPEDREDPVAGLFYEGFQGEEALPWESAGVERLEKFGEVDGNIRARNGNLSA